MVSGMKIGLAWVMHIEQGRRRNRRRMGDVMTTTNYTTELKAARAFYERSPDGQHDNFVSDVLTEAIRTEFCGLRYVTIGGKAGRARVRTTRLPEWMLEHPGTLIIAISFDR